MNRAQAELVALLAEPRRNVMVVGDDDQSIYRFRGAATGAIVDFLEQFRRARTIVLRRNYRSPRPILDAAYRLIRFNDPDRLEVQRGIVKRLVARSAGRGARRGAPVLQPVVRDRLGGGRLGGGRDRPADRRRGRAARPRGAGPGERRRATPSCAPQRRRGPLALLGRIGPLRRGRRSASCSRSCAPSATRSSSVDVYALAASERVRARGRRPRRTGRAGRGGATGRCGRRSSRWKASRASSAFAPRPGRRWRGSSPTCVASSSSATGARLAKSYTTSCGHPVHWRGSCARPRRPADEALSNIARFFDIVRAQSDLLADDRAVFLAPHLQTLIDAGDDPATADLDPDADAVAVVTVHKAKGLEWPVVFMIGLVDGRFPARGRREQLAVPDALLRGVFPTGDAHVQEERRLFYVGMTRARDELVLAHALDYGGRRARRVSPFVLEALDLPAGASPAPRAASPLERLAPFEGPPVEAPAARRRSDGTFEPLVLSFYQVDDYLTCPLKYRYVHVMRVPIAPHHALVYGSALHQAVQEFHRRHARGEVMSPEALEAAFEAAWTSEGFVSREHEEARLAAGRAALRRFREAQLAPGAVIPAYVEREFVFTLDGDRVRGRMDRVDVIPLGPEDAAGDDTAGDDVDGGPAGAATGAAGGGPDAGGVAVPALAAGATADVVEPTLPLLRERVVITDYKSSDVRDPARARERARDSLQLTMYAMAWQAQTGRLPDAVALHFLESGLVGTAEVDSARVERGVADIRTAADGIRERRFEPTPSYMACSWCALRDVCPASAAK